MGTDNVTFGPGLLRLGDDVDVNVKVDEVLTAPEDYESPDFTFSKTTSFEFESMIDPSTLKELAGEMSKPEPFYMEYDSYCYIQNRRHKKKRINKKWAKRYGYREVPCRYRVENCYVEHNRFDDFEIVSKPPKIMMSSLYGRSGG